MNHIIENILFGFYSFTIYFISFLFDITISLFTKYFIVILPRDSSMTKQYISLIDLKIHPPFNLYISNIQVSNTEIKKKRVLFYTHYLALKHMLNFIKNK